MISVCIPTYEQHGSGAHYLKILLQSLEQQQGVDFDVIVSDNSAGAELEKLCAAFSAGLSIRYLRNPVRGVSNNSNNAIANATSDFIKIMYQDDLLMGPHSLVQFAEALTRRAWAVSIF
jgi:glycosyltransferase involved in cell wall biosynthesis